MPDFPFYDGMEHPSVWLQGLLCHQIQEKPEKLILALAWEHMTLRVQSCLNVLERLMRQMNGGNWTWNYTRLAAALTKIYEQIKEYSSPEHAAQSVMIGVAKTVAAVGAAAVATPIVATAGLALVGFGSGGVIAGSIAAGIQSIFYGGAVASGSAFAFCQSLAMGGAAAAATVSGVGAAAGGTAAAIGEVGRKRPSTTWDDGPDFVPSKELLEEMTSFQ